MTTRAEHLRVVGERDRLRAAVQRVLERNASIGTLCEADEYELRSAMCICTWERRTGYVIRTAVDPTCTAHTEPEAKQ